MHAVFVLSVFCCKKRCSLSQKYFKSILWHAITTEKGRGPTVSCFSSCHAFDLTNEAKKVRMAARTAFGSLLGSLKRQRRFQAGPEGIWLVILDCASKTTVVRMI
jgi:hypothetical protein